MTLKSNIMSQLKIGELFGLNLNLNQHSTHNFALDYRGARNIQVSDYAGFTVLVQSQFQMI